MHDGRDRLRHRTSRFLAFFLANVLLICEGAVRRDYYIQAEEVLHDYGPTGVDGLTGQPFAGHEHADHLMVNNPSLRQIGSKYWKCRYIEYTDGTFTQQVPRPPWMGLLGPVLRAEVGDYLGVLLSNKNCSKAITMHPHGVSYTRHNEGATYLNGQPAVNGSQVLPGQTFRYVWLADEHSGPGPDEPSSVVWPYHSHAPSRVDSNSGLVGCIVVARRGEAQKDGTPSDVDAEFVLYLTAFDENLSYLLDRNIREFLQEGGSPLSDAQVEALKEDEGLKEGNIMSSINGLKYANLQGITVPVGKRVRWYVFCLGTETDLHYMSWRGHTVLETGKRVSGVALMAGVSTVADMVPTETGQWAMMSHTNAHFQAGMSAMYTVQGASIPSSTDGRLRQHFIRAEEVLWDYAPSGQTLYGTSVTQDDDSKVFFERTGSVRGIGGEYWKCIYRGYTDASFTTRAPVPAKWEHLGFLGPPIHAEVGDSVTVVFQNRCAKEASISVPAALTPKQHEGWYYGSAFTKAGSGVVASGGTHTYEWKVVEGPGPLDPCSVGFIYASHAPMPTDTYSGLAGPLIITAFGCASDAGEPLDVDAEVVVMFSVMNEGESYLLDRNIDAKIPGLTAQQVTELKADGVFQESNLMHSINGFLYGNMPKPQLSAGRKARVYAMALGSEVDMHSVKISGHSFLSGEHRQAQLSLVPGEVKVADILPTAGDWAIWCHTNDHLTAGMSAMLSVAANPRDDPMVVRPVRGATRRYYLQAEDIVWDYGPGGQDVTGMHPYHGNWSAAPKSPMAMPFAETEDGPTFMSNDPAGSRIGRQYVKCLFVGYNADFSVPEDRSSGSKWHHLGFLGPIIHAEEGDTLVIELRNRCTIPVSLHSEILRVAKSDEGWQYEDSETGTGVVQPGGSRVYTWQAVEGPGPRDGSSVGTTYYSMANRMVADTYTGLKGPLVITRKGFAKADGSPRDVDTEFAVVFEVTDESSSLYLEDNFERFVNSKRSTPLTASEKAVVFEDDDFKESNLMHGINGLLYGNLKGLVAHSETKVRWYVLGLGTEVDMHPVHWHGHVVEHDGRHVDVVMDTPGTGITADMYTSNIGSWMFHCHVNDHVAGGMVTTYEVVPNPEKSQTVLSSCQQMYTVHADQRRANGSFDETWFEGYGFQKTLSPHYRVAYTVNYQDMYFDMAVAARTVGWLGIGFYDASEADHHAMLNTDMVVAWVQDGTVFIEDRFASALDTPNRDVTLGGTDQLSNKEGQQVGGFTYVRFRRSFRPADLDDFDYGFGMELDHVKVVFAYSSVNSNQFVYHGPTRGYGTLTWNTNCSTNLFFDILSGTCQACSFGYYRIAWDPRYVLTRCERCPAGTLADTRGDARETEECTPCGFDHATTVFPGATSVGECGCASGYFHPCQGEGCLMTATTWTILQQGGEGFCRPCPPRLICNGGAEDPYLDSGDRRHAQPLVPFGYYMEADADPETPAVFKCFGNGRRCPGGPPETCAAGRLGLQCGACKPGLTGAADGTCRPCRSEAMLAVGVCAVLVIGIVGLIYYLVDTQDASKQTHQMLFVGIAGSQLFTLIQIMGTISRVTVTWPTILQQVLDFARLFVFDISWLEPECFAEVRPLNMYAIKVSMAASILAIVTLVHVVVVITCYKRNFKRELPKLVGAVGTVIYIFFISIVATLVSPLECNLHPTGQWTMARYPTALCWEETSEQMPMIAIMVVGMIVPVAFLAACCWAVMVYPRKAHQGDASFLRVVSFLTIRFRAEVHWYVIFYLLRNLVLSLIPLSPDVVLQTMGIQVVLLTSFVVTLTVRPWRVHQANNLDAAVVGTMLFLITLGSFFAEDPDPEAMSYICLATIFLVVAAAVAIMAFNLCSRLLVRERRFFEFFVCHHKATCGCFARLLKMLLESSQSVTGRVFIDCDDLTDLDNLFNTVGTDVENLLVICCRDILSRPWCVGEMATAHSHGVNIINVIMRDFVFPTDEWIGDCASYLDVSILTNRHISVVNIQATFQALRKKPSVVLPARMCRSAIDNLAPMLTQKALSDHQDSGWIQEVPSNKEEQVPETGTLVVLDHTNTEAFATGHTLCMLLAPHYMDSPRSLPFVLPDQAEWPETGRQMLLICTRGCLQRDSVLKLIHQGEQRKGFYVPILADESFIFPMSGSFLHENYNTMLSVTMGQGDPSELEAKVVQIFQDICVRFQPMNASELVLVAAARSVSDRLHLARRLSSGRSRRGDEALDGNGAGVRRNSTHRSRRSEDGVGARQMSHDSSSGTSYLNQRNSGKNFGDFGNEQLEASPPSIGSGSQIHGQNGRDRHAGEGYPSTVTMSDGIPELLDDDSDTTYSL